mgnify:CR=1 FL=1|jgi:glutathione-regulated potassium-efflux system ancillary protein KefG
MRTLIIIAHPELESSNLQPFFKAAVENYSDVNWHPLSTDFDIEQEQKLLLAQDRIIFEFPLYWYSAPAILKQWMDSVMTTKFVTGNRYALSGKELGLVVSTGDAESSFQAGATEKFTMSELMRPFEAFANKTRMKYLPLLTIHQFLYLNPDEQQRLLVNYQQYITNPRLDHFKDQESWFENELQNRIEATDPHAAELQQILDTIKNRQDELDDLQWNLSEMKKEEDS